MPDFIRQEIRCVRGQIGAYEPTSTLDHVALRALRLTEEQRRATLRVAWNRQRIASTLERSQVPHQRLKFGVSEGRKIGHSGQENAIVQDSKQFLVAAMSNLRPSGNVRTALSASPVQPVATSTGAGKDLARGGILLLALCSARFPILARDLRMSSPAAGA
jgi:hypothetical protein